MMADDNGVYVKPTDNVAVVVLLKLLSERVDSLKEKLRTDGLDDKTRFGLAGAVEAYTDLHNRILQSVKNARMKEILDNSDNGRGFDA